MRKSVYGKMLSAVLAATLALTPSLTAFANDGVFDATSPTEDVLEQNENEDFCCKV